MMNAQVVQYMVNLLTSVLYQPLAELDKRLAIHRFGIDHKTNFTLIRDRGDQINPFTFCIKPDGWGFSFRCIASTMLTIIAQARFIPAVNLCYFLPCLSHNRWILFLKPFFYRLRILFIFATQWLLRGKPPSLEIFTYRSNRNFNARNLLVQLFDSLAGSKRKGKFKLIWRFIGNCPLHPLFLFGAKRPVNAFRTSTFFTFYGFITTLFVLFIYTASCRFLDTDQITYFLIGFSRFTQSDYLILNQLLCFCCQCACIYFFHVLSITFLKVFNYNYSLIKLPSQ